MFTDTKNLTHSNVELNFMKSSEKSKGKLRKVWKPLLRLIRLKSSPAKNEHAIAHPNNVNLNNSRVIKDICDDVPQEFTTFMQKAIIVHKEEYDQDEETSQVCGSTKDVTVISSASIEKAPAPTCTTCIHGRNCQHMQFHSDLQIVYHNDAILPINYLLTDDGSFFWTTTTSDSIDDELLSAWLCHSYQQIPLQAATTTTTTTLH